MQRSRFRSLLVLLLALLSVVLVLASLVSAEPPAGRSAPDPASGRQRRKAFVERFDSNGDGRLTGEERRAAREFLQSIRHKRPTLAQTVQPGTTDLYQASAGPHALTVVKTFVLPGRAGGRDIPLRITIPDGDQPAPLVVLCHGAMGSKDNLQPLATYWATHGYVVIQPTFGDSLTTMSEKEKLQYNSPVELVNSWRTKQHWDDRPREVSHIIDSLETIERRVDTLAGRIDADRIAVAGHSFGAHTAMLLAGMTLQVPGRKTPDFRDDRIDAKIMISPQGPNASLNAKSFKSIRGPFLMITGDNDGTPIKGREDKAGSWRKQAFDLSRPGQGFLLWIDGAYHGFGGITGTKYAYPNAGPLAPDQVYYVKTVCLAFLDAFLRDDPQARSYLTSGRLARATDAAARIIAK